MEVKEEIVIIRPYNSTIDAAFVFSSWRNAVWYDDHKTDKIDAEFYHKKTKEIKSCLANYKTNVKMAALKSNPDFLVGYVITTDSVVEFIYVKLDYREQGIASILCKGLTKFAEPVTKIGASILRRIKENK